MELRLNILSPVHIGSGNEIQPFDYVTRFRDGRGVFSRVNLEAFAERILDIKPDAMDDFTTWITQTAERLDNTPNRDKPRVRQEFKLDRFARERLQASELANALVDDDQLYHYQQPINTDQNHQVKEQIKTADNGLCVPGSSLKGALRTALAFLVLIEADEAFKQDLLNGVRGTDQRGLSSYPEEARQLKARRSFRELNQLEARLGEEIEKAVFRCGAERRGRVSYSEIHFDLMRSVQVSDTFDPAAQLAVLMTNTFLRQKDRDNPGRTARLAAQVPVLLEALLPGSTFTCRIDVDLGFLRLAREAKNEWVGLDARFARLFGFSRNELSQMDNATASRKVIDRLLDAMAKFSMAIVAEEQRWAGQFERQETERLNDFYRKLTAIKNETPVRLGWGSHFMSTTLLLALRNDPVLGNVITDLVRAFEVDLIWSMKGKAGDPSTRTVRLETFPRSRRLAALGKSAGAPFGWAALSELSTAPGESLMDVDELTRLFRQERPQSHGGRQGQRPDVTPRETPRQAEQANKALQEAKRALQGSKPQQQSSSVRENQRVNAEVISNDGRKVVVRLLENQNEEISFQQSSYPPKPGSKVKVKVTKLDVKTGRVTQVRL